MNTNLERNIALWAHQDPQAAVYLPYVECEHLQYCITKENELNLKNEEEGFFFHSNSGAVKEIEKQISKINIEEIEIFYYYGLGLGYAYDALRPWLKKNKKRRLVILEEDLAVIRRFFESDLAADVLKDKQTALIYFSNIDADKSALSELYWRFMSIKLSVAALPAYLKRKAERVEQLEQKLVYDATVRYALVDEYLKYGIVFFRNFYHNIRNLPGSFLGNKLFSQFKGIPAIICGAGPSLTPQLEQLAELKQNALIFAGGSGMNALNSIGMQPHFGAGIDPNLEQHVRLSQLELKTPFFYRNRLYYEILPLVKGERLYVTGSGGYDIAKWFEEKLNISSEEEELDEGFNIVNFCISIAHAMGCSPIILVGMDLAFTEMESYAKGVVKKSKVKKSDILSAEDLDSTAIEWKDIYGKPTYTLWKWVAESNWIGNFAKEHPEVQLINATEGGIGFPDIPNETLEYVKKIELNKSYDLQTQVKKAIENAAIPDVTEKAVAEALDEMKRSLEKCLNHLQILIDEGEKQKAAIEREQKKIGQSGVAALSEIELADEPAYIYILEIFNAVYTRVLNYEFQIASQSKTEWKRAIKQQDLSLQRLQFLKKVCQANLMLIEDGSCVTA